MTKKTAIIVGYGDRGEVYCKYALSHSEDIEIIGVVEPNAIRLEKAKKLFSIAGNMCFDKFDSFIHRGKIADCVLNCTMDKQHIETTIPILKLGYDVLLEKPITNNKKELLMLQDIAKQNHNKIVVCHVLRYTDFYRSIKKNIMDGVIGEIRHIETAENVNVPHASISFIRGKWNNEEKCGSSMLLQKCCHDFDILCWLNNNARPVSVSSFGGRDYFIPSKAPSGAGTKCLVDCPIEKDCPYSAKIFHLDNNIMPITAWEDIDADYENITYDERLSALKSGNRNGQCIFKTEGNVVDHQMTMMKFSNGSTAYHNMFSSTARGGRRIMIYGTLGEIEGFSSGSYIIRTYNKVTMQGDERVVDISANSESGHYGGDSGIMWDFVNVINGLPPSISTSSLDDSVYSHLCVYAADQSMREDKIVKITQL